MSKMIAFWLVVFLVGVTLSGAMSSGGGFVVTLITAPVAKTDTTITVKNTSQFLSADFLTIGEEQIVYTGKTATQFTGCTRGYNSTTATTHGIGANVYTQQASIINEALNINPTAVRTNSGIMGIVQIPVKFFTHALPNLVTMNFDFFEGDLAIVGYIFMACSFGMVISLAMGMLWIAAGVIKLL